MGLPQFTLTTNGTSHAMALEGMKGHASRVTVDHKAGEPTKVYLEFPADCTVEGEGIIHVVKGMDQREVVLEFLESLDPSHLEKMALEEFDDPQMTTGQSFKVALRKIVSGD